jgi:uncharacterized protein YbgA (DUF1722 family)/uncharacterized protein YbbK (DUF523 family)
MSESSTVKLGVSACLLGEAVRYDGQHKHNHYLTDVLGKYVEWLPVCPEVECGMSIPREAMHLTGSPDSPRLVTVHSGIDHSSKMQTWCEKRVKELVKEDLCGFIFKSNSPSSGLLRVKVFNAKGIPEKIGVGFFAREFTKSFPLLPVEEEGRLNDSNIRDRFIDHVTAYSRWLEYLKNDSTVKSLQNFHARHKYMIMAHSPKDVAVLGRIAADANDSTIKKAQIEYIELLVSALKLQATIRKNTNVLQHIAGYFKKELEDFEKQELQKSIEEYHQENFPLLATLVLLQHFAKKYNKNYLLEQYYLNPSPMELYLKYHV